MSNEGGFSINQALYFKPFGDATAALPAAAVGAVAWLAAVTVGLFL